MLLAASGLGVQSCFTIDNPAKISSRGVAVFGCKHQFAGGIAVQRFVQGIALQRFVQGIAVQRFVQGIAVQRFVETPTSVSTLRSAPHHRLE